MKNRIVSNFHSHTYLCKHAKGKPEDYILEAISNKMLYYGISDHIPKENSTYCMNINDFEHYFMMCQKAKDKFKDDIKVFIGLECEVERDNLQRLHYYHQKCDYLILAVHYIEHNNKIIPSSKIHNMLHKKIYADKLISDMSLGLFDFIAHPDLFLNQTSNDELTSEDINIIDMIIKYSIKYDLPLELNTNGLRITDKNKNICDLTVGYPNIGFWKVVAEYNAKVIINSDCHKPSEVVDDYFIKLHKLADKLKLNVIELPKNLDRQI